MQESNFAESHLTKALKENFGESFVTAMNLLYKLDEDDKQRTISFMTEILKSDKYSHEPIKN